MKKMPPVGSAFRYRPPPPTAAEREQQRRDEEAARAAAAARAAEGASSPERLLSAARAAIYERDQLKADHEALRAEAQRMREQMAQSTQQAEHASQAASAERERRELELQHRTEENMSRLEGMMRTMQSQMQEVRQERDVMQARFEESQRTLQDLLTHDSQRQRQRQQMLEDQQRHEQELHRSQVHHSTTTTSHSHSHGARFHAAADRGPQLMTLAELEASQATNAPPRPASSPASNVPWHDQTHAHHTSSHQRQQRQQHQARSPYAQSAPPQTGAAPANSLYGEREVEPTLGNEVAAQREALLLMRREVVAMTTELNLEARKRAEFEHSFQRLKVYAQTLQEQAAQLPPSAEQPARLAHAQDMAVQLEREALLRDRDERTFQDRLARYEALRREYIEAVARIRALEARAGLEPIRAALYELPSLNMAPDVSVRARPYAPPPAPLVTAAATQGLPSRDLASCAEHATQRSSLFLPSGALVGSSFSMHTPAPVPTSGAFATSATSLASSSAATIGRTSLATSAHFPGGPLGIPLAQAAAQGAAQSAAQSESPPKSAPRTATRSVRFADEAVRDAGLRASLGASFHLHGSGSMGGGQGHLPPAQRLTQASTSFLSHTLPPGAASGPGAMPALKSFAAHHHCAHDEPTRRSAFLDADGTIARPLPEDVDAGALRAHFRAKAAATAAVGGLGVGSVRDGHAGEEVGEGKKEEAEEDEVGEGDDGDNKFSPKTPPSKIHGGGGGGGGGAPAPSDGSPTLSQKHGAGAAHKRPGAFLDTPATPGMPPLSVDDLATPGPPTPSPARMAVSSATRLSYNASPLGSAGYAARSGLATGKMLGPDERQELATLRQHMAATEERIKADVARLAQMMSQQQQQARVAASTDVRGPRAARGLPSPATAKSDAANSANGKSSSGRWVWVEDGAAAAEIGVERVGQRDGLRDSQRDAAHDDSEGETADTPLLDTSAAADEAVDRVRRRRTAARQTLASEQLVEAEATEKLSQLRSSSRQSHGGSDGVESEDAHSPMQRGVDRAVSPIRGGFSDELSSHSHSHSHSHIHTSSHSQRTSVRETTDSLSVDSGRREEQRREDAEMADALAAAAKAAKLLYANSQRMKDMLSREIQHEATLCPSPAPPSAE